MKRTVAAFGAFTLLVALLVLCLGFWANIAVAGEVGPSATSGLCERLHGLSRLLPLCRENPPDLCPNVPGTQTSTPCADALCRDQGGTWNGTSCDVPYVKITYPHNGDKLVNRDIIQITWEAKFVETCHIMLSPGLGSGDWIATFVPVSQKSIPWGVWPMGQSGTDEGLPYDESIIFICGGDMGAAGDSVSFTVVSKPPSDGGRPPRVPHR